MVVFGQGGCISAKWLYLGKSGCIPAIVVVFKLKCLYSNKVVLPGQNGCIWAKMVVFGQKFLFSDKGGCIRAVWLYSCKSDCIPAKFVVF